MEDNITLVIRGEEFTASKTNLSEYSDYFRAMFSGSYVENDQKQVKIDVLDPNIMGIILQYIRIGLIDLNEYSLETVGEVSEAANFLQITELLKQIEYTLYLQLCVSNWYKIMMIAETSALQRLEELAAAHGLLSFKRMKPEYIQTIQKLFWYLSHPYLDAESEFEVFKFGQKWITQNQCGGDALLIILCCLDYKRITVKDLNSMKGLIEQYAYSLAEKVIECLSDYADEENIFSVKYFIRYKSRICAMYTETVYREVINLIRTSVKRQLVLTPVVPMWPADTSNRACAAPHFLYTYTQETEFQKYLEVAEHNLWGWSVVAWGLTKIVVVGGEFARGSGNFMRDVKVYDTLRNEWIDHGVTLPVRRHAGVAILGDLLYIVGGVGGYRVVLDTAIVYDLKMRSFRKIASFPDAIQNPAVCAHNNAIYASGQKTIFRYEETGSSDQWRMIINTEIRASCMISFKGYIYFGQNYFCNLYRFQTDSKSGLENVGQFNNPPATMCHLGDRVIAVTRTTCAHAEIMAVEEFNEKTDLENKPKVEWLQASSDIKVNDVAGSCVLVMTVPPMNKEISLAYHRRQLSRFTEEQ